MALFKSKNPTLSEDVFLPSNFTDEYAETMTIKGAVNKTGILATIALLSAAISWIFFANPANAGIMQIAMYGGFIGGFILALVISFKKHLAPKLSPVYCIFKGIALGAFSLFFETIFPGIAIQALILTFGILFSLLAIYRSGLIKVTENFKLIVGAATMGIMLFYLVAFVGSFVGFNVPLIHSNGTWGIVFSVGVIIIASLNLVMDFDFIEKGEQQGAPKYMEWYAAFGLMVTIIWLYIEILRLLAKLRSRD